MPERAAEEAAHASETAVEALSHRLEELLESRPQSRNEVECLLQGAYWQGRFACRQRLLTRGCSGLVESVEERAQPKQQDEDLLGAILRRTQSSVKATAGRGAGGPSYASGAPPRPPALDEETAVDGLFDPVLLLRRQGERAAAAASATPPHVGGGRSGAACRDDGLDAELAERFMSTPAHVYERGGDGATDLTQFKARRRRRPKAQPRLAFVGPRGCDSLTPPPRPSQQRGFLKFKKEARQRGRVDVVRFRCDPFPPGLP